MASTIYKIVSTVFSKYCTPVNYSIVVNWNVIDDLTCSPVLDAVKLAVQVALQAVRCMEWDWGWERSRLYAEWSETGVENGAAELCYWLLDNIIDILILSAMC